MEEKKKVKYNMWQNTSFMIANAWRVCKSVIFMCMALAVATAGMTVAELLIAPAILQKVESGSRLSELLLTIGVFSGVLLLLAGLKAYINTNALFGRIAVRTDIIKQIGNKMAATSYPNILDTDFISLENKATQACSSNQEPTEAIWTTWTEILINIIGFAVYLALLSGLHPMLMVVVIVTTMVRFGVNNHFNKWGYEHRKEEKEYYTRMNYVRSVVTQRRFAKDIRIFGLREWLEDVWGSTFKLYQDFIKRREQVYIWTDVAELMLTLLRNGIAYAYLIHITIENGLPASEFLLYFGAVSGFTQWIMGILLKFNELNKQSIDLSAVREFLEWPEPFKFEEGESLIKDVKRQYEICLKDVSFRYPKAEKNTISHINLTIRPGEKLAIVGLNGAGKTTLVKLLCGFLDPTEGSVLLNGEDIRKYNRREYYNLFAAVFQDFSVLECSVAENVAQRVDGVDISRVRECLRQAGLTEKISSLPKDIYTNIGREVYEDGVELSGGQLQRLMLARALYKDAPLIVLDEPTAALDPIAENDIYMKYSEMTDGRSALFISHRLASTRFCDRILFMENGQISEEGTHDSLLAFGGGYAKLYEVQSRYYQEGGEADGEH